MDFAFHWGWGELPGEVTASEFPEEVTLNGEGREVRDAAMQICDVFQTGSPENEDCKAKGECVRVGEEELEGNDLGAK